MKKGRRRERVQITITLHDWFWLLNNVIAESTLKWLEWREKKKSSDFGEFTENNSGLSWLHFSSFCQGTISEENQGLSYISTHWFIVILLGPWLEHLIPRSSLLLAKDPGLDKALQFSYQRTFRRGSAALQRAFKVSNGPPPARHLFFLMAQRPMQCQNHHLHLLLSSDINSIHVKKREWETWLLTHLFFLRFETKFILGSFFSAFILLVRFPRFSDNTRMIKTFHWRVIWAPSIFSSHNEHREEWRYVPFSCFTREAKTFIMLGKQQQKRKPWIATFLSSKKGNMSTWSFLDYFQL